MELNFLDLFAGAGFIRRGMEKAGHKCMGYVEIDKYARKSYEAIHDTEGEWTAHDITAVTDESIRQFGRDYEPIHIITGGFPCQAFSIAGSRKGFEDARGTLFFEIARFASVLRPKYLLLENVDGLRSHDNGRTLATILYILGELDYDVQAQVLNSKDFGVPQNRERIFFVCFNRDYGTESRPQIFPIGGSNQNTLKQVIPGRQGERVHDPEGGLSVALIKDGGGQGAKTGLYMVSVVEGGLRVRDDETVTCLDANYHKGIDIHGARTGVMVFQKTHGSTTTLHCNETGTLQAARSDKVPCVEARPCLTPGRVEKQQNGRRFKEPGEEMFTLTAQDVHGVYDGVRIRKLTPRECWRLQGASDETFNKAAAVNSDSQLYKQAGNGATETVVYEIARRLV